VKPHKDWRDFVERSKKKIPRVQLRELHHKTEISAIDLADKN